MLALILVILITFAVHAPCLSAPSANKPMSAPAHALSPEKVTEDLGANAESGLTAEEAKQRLQEFGQNEFGNSEGVQPVKIFIGQLANALTLVSKKSSSCWRVLLPEVWRWHWHS